MSDLPSSSNKYKTLTSFKQGVSPSMSDQEITDIAVQAEKFQTGREPQYVGSSVPGRVRQNFRSFQTGREPQYVGPRKYQPL